jgi:hypothetical protein
VYVRESDGEELSFIVSGKLWRDALVMFDRGTESHWSQITGTAFKGERAGQSLAPYPFEMTTWKEWRQAHPRTRVLYKDPDDRQTASVYESYFSDSGRLGIFGRKVDDDRLELKSIVVAVEVEGASMVFPRAELPRDRVVEISVGDVPVMVVPTAAGGHVAYDRRVAGRTVSFTLGEGLLVADEGELGPWDARTGLPGGNANSADPALRPVRAHVTFWFGWVSFFPQADIWQGE